MPHCKRDHVVETLVHEGDLFGIISTGPSSLSIDMTYDRAADRPKTLGVESVGEDVLTALEEKELRRHCKVFYSKRLAEAVAAAFNA